MKLRYRWRSNQFYPFKHQKNETAYIPTGCTSRSVSEWIYFCLRSLNGMACGSSRYTNRDNFFQFFLQSDIQYINIIDLHRREMMVSSGQLSDRNTNNLRQDVWHCHRFDKRKRRNFLIQIENTFCSRNHWLDNRWGEHEIRSETGLEKKKKYEIIIYARIFVVLSNIKNLDKRH